MKVRIGFVSNSSSSSFVIPLRKLSLEQVCRIENHSVWGKKLGIWNSDTDPWNIEIKNCMLYGSTFMDNFDMEEFLKKLGVTGVIWGEYGTFRIEPTICDSESCKDCQLRFICYTNE